jgi:hypothetical protein
MADKKISELTEIGTIDSGSVFPIDSAAGETRKITFENVEDGIAHGNIQDVGTNTHDQIDTAISDSATHISKTDNPHSVTKAQVGLGSVDNNSLLTILQSVYPVGSIYFNKTDNTNPGTRFGFGTWVAIEGYVVAGYKSGDANFGTAGGTVGVASVTLTALQSGLREHSHVQKVGSGATPSTHLMTPQIYYGNTNTYDSAGSTALSGPAVATDAHTNIQPTLVAYVWERTV